MTTPSALPYHEPSIVTILIISSFLLSLNFVNYLLDRIVYCGLVGQILIGVAWGTPGAAWLSEALEGAVVELGYLGLMLIVYRGGLSTSLPALKVNLSLSILVATIGISCPIALSFILKRLVKATSLQAFAAGAALCSTSLGTTFTVLSTAGLTKSRLGTVLSSAAMIDDVVGLVMVRVISNLGGSKNDDFAAVTVVRPILVSIGFAVFVPLACRLVVKPLTIRSAPWTAANQSSLSGKILSSRGSFLVYQIATLIALVTAASYAGTSNLFVAYLAGAAITWWSELHVEMEKNSAVPSALHTSEAPSAPASEPASNAVIDARVTTSTDAGAVRESRTAKESEQSSSGPPAIHGRSGIRIYEHYLGQVVDYLLRPMFFASVGFSIPIGSMFAGEVVWKGVIYSILMSLGKLLCGLCLVRIKWLVNWTAPRVLSGRMKGSMSKWQSIALRVFGKEKRTMANVSQTRKPQSEVATASQDSTIPTPSPSRTPHLQPRSLYPAAILGGAMVARGEIGFLISSIAQAQGIFQRTSEQESRQLFLVVNWAILLCTIAGPLMVGLLVKRVRRLQDAERRMKTGREDPMGVWGVVHNESRCD